MIKGIFVLVSLSGVTSAGTPVWTFTPLTETTVNVSSTGTASVEQKACAIPFLSEAGQASPRLLADIFLD